MHQKCRLWMRASAPNSVAYCIVVGNMWIYISGRKHRVHLAYRSGKSELFVLFGALRSAAASPHLGLFDEFSHLTQLETHRCLLCICSLIVSFWSAPKVDSPQWPVSKFGHACACVDQNLNLPNGFFLLPAPLATLFFSSSWRFNLMC
jgi:hypothetical protein